jgi:hypothetical protein
MATAIGCALTVVLHKSYEAPENDNGEQGRQHRHQQVTEALKEVGPVDGYGVKQFAGNTGKPGGYHKECKPDILPPYIASTVGSAVRVLAVKDAWGRWASPRK